MELEYVSTLLKYKWWWWWWYPTTNDQQPNDNGIHMDFFLRKSNWNKLVKEPFFYFVACFQNYMYIILHKKIASMLWWLLLLSNYDCCCRCCCCRCCCINFYLWNCRFGFEFFFLVKVFPPPNSTAMQPSDITYPSKISDTNIQPIHFSHSFSWWNMTRQPIYSKSMDSVFIVCESSYNKFWY